MLLAKSALKKYMNLYHPDFFRNTTLAFLVASILLSCARQSAPTGGPKDVTPPKLDTLASTPNYSTRFDRKHIDLLFDEWVTLNDVANQVVISPPLSKRLRVTLKNKTVQIDLPESEVLRPNTTYTIQFGQAIKDLHEGNANDKLRFVFSTGDFIDSLSVGGNVTDAYTGEPVEKVTVMFYDITTDSILRQERPYYFGITDKSGQFTIENMKAGRYKAVAIEDADQNLKWAGETERIAFFDTLVPVRDSQRQVLAFRLFGEHKAFRLFDKNAERYGQVKLTYTDTPDSVQVKSDQPNMRLLTEKSLDTLLVWYDTSDSIPWQLIAGKDTVQVRALNRSDFIKKNRQFFADEILAGAAQGTRARRGQPTEPTAPVGKIPPPKTITQSQAKPAELLFKTPVSIYDTSRWILTVDSMRLTDYQVRPDTALARKLLVDVRWKPGKTYGLQLLPGAMVDFFGVANTDTLQRFFSIPTEKQLGGLNLRIESITAGQHYIVQLQNGSALEQERRFVADSTSQRLVFTGLPATTLTVVLIEDSNVNGRWDSGDYYRHKQPERVFIKKLEALRANWEVEATVTATAGGLERRRGN